MTDTLDLLQLRDGATVDIPREACEFLAEGLELRAPIGQQRAARFEMVANTGKEMPHWWFRKMVVELKGVKHRQKLPVLKDHDPDQRIGYTESISLDEKRGLIAEGRMLSTELAEQVRAEAAEGFPWQASVHLQISKLQVLRDGEEAEVNSRTFRGPGAIIRQSTLREVTFTALGADDETSAQPLSRNGAGTSVTATVSLKGGQTMSDTDEGQQPDQNTAAKPKAPQRKGAGGAWTQADEAARQARLSATEEERQRVLQILRSVSPEHQLELALELIEDGTASNEALLRVNQDLVEQLQLRGSMPKPSSTKSLARGNTRVAVETPAEDAEEDAQLAAMEDGEEKWQAQWKQDASLRKEFGDDEKVWLAFKRNEWRSRSYREAKQFAGRD